MTIFPTFFLHSEKFNNISYILLILSNYNYKTLPGQHQEERKDTTTSWLHETKQGVYGNIWCVPFLFHLLFKANVNWKIRPRISLFNIYQKVDVIPSAYCFQYILKDQNLKGNNIIDTVSQSHYQTEETPSHLLFLFGSTNMC